MKLKLYLPAIVCLKCCLLNAAYTTEVDWYADNRMDLNPNANVSTGLTGNDNAGKDIVNQ